MHTILRSTIQNKSKLFNLLKRIPENQRYFNSIFIQSSSNHILNQNDTVKLSTSTRNVNSAVVGDDWVVKSPLADTLPAKDDITTLILNSAERWGNRTAFECGLTGRSYTFHQIKDAILRTSAKLQGLQVGNGTVVGLLMVNCPEYIIGFCGTTATGAMVSNINPAFTPAEVARQLKDSGAKVLICDPMVEPLAVGAVKSLSSEEMNIQILVTGTSSMGNPNLLEIAFDPKSPFADFPLAIPEAPLVLQYSSGTTGVPKGVYVTNAAASANIPMFFKEEVFTLQEATSNSQDTVMGLLPFFHAVGMYAIMCCSFISGAKVITLPKFIPEKFIEIIVKNRMRILHMVPPIVNFLAFHPLVTKQHLDSVRVTMNSAAAIPLPVAEAFKAKCPNDVFLQELYGMTESMPTHMTLIGKEKIGSCGVPISNVQCKVMDLETNKPLPPNTPGELWMKTPSMMTGYHNRPEETAQTITEDGWLRTGDVVTYDEQANFYVVDRIKELIKVKGIQVSPSEIEEELLTHPAIAEVGVGKVSNERAGELPKAYIIQKPNTNVSAEEIHSFLKERLAPHKQLAGGIAFVKELPKNQTGKLLRKQLENSPLVD